MNGDQFEFVAFDNDVIKCVSDDFPYVVFGEMPKKGKFGFLSIKRETSVYGGLDSFGRVQRYAIFESASIQSAPSSVNHVPLM